MFKLGPRYFKFFENFENLLYFMKYLILVELINGLIFKSNFEKNQDFSMIKFLKNRTSFYKRLLNLFLTIEYSSIRYLNHVCNCPRKYIAIKAYFVFNYNDIKTKVSLIFQKLIFD